MPATDFQKKCVAIGLKNMFSSEYFDVCKVTEAGKVLGVPVHYERDFQAMRLLHCVNWSDMPRDFPKEVMARTLSMLSPEKRLDVETFEHALDCGGATPLERTETALAVSGPMNNLVEELAARVTEKVEEQRMENGLLRRLRRNLGL